jgi:hypothetical protein
MIIPECVSTMESASILLPTAAGSKYLTPNQPVPLDYMSRVYEISGLGLRSCCVEIRISPETNSPSV